MKYRMISGSCKIGHFGDATHTVAISADSLDVCLWFVCLYVYLFIAQIQTKGFSKILL